MHGVSSSIVATVWQLNCYDRRTSSHKGRGVVASALTFTSSTNYAVARFSEVRIAPPGCGGRLYAPALSFDSGSSVRPAKYCGVTPKALASLRTVDGLALDTPRSNLFMLVKWRPLIWANSFWVKKLRWRVSLSLPSCPSSTRAIYQHCYTCSLFCTVKCYTFFWALRLWSNATGFLLIVFRFYLETLFKVFPNADRPDRMPSS